MKVSCTGSVAKRLCPNRAPGAQSLVVLSCHGALLTELLLGTDPYVRKSVFLLFLLLWLLVRGHVGPTR